MEGRKPLIVDVNPGDVSYTGKSPSGNITSDNVKFALRTLGYGLKMLLNFVGWSIKMVVGTAIEGFKIMAEGSRSLNDEMRGNRPRYESAKQSAYADNDAVMPWVPGAEYEIRLKKRF